MGLLNSMAVALFRDEGGKNSSSKFWFTVFNTATIIIYLKVGLNVANLPNPPLEGLAWLVFAISGVITANKLATLIAKKKFGVSIDEPPTTSANPDK